MTPREKTLRNLLNLYREAVKIKAERLRNAEKYIEELEKELHAVEDEMFQGWPDKERIK